MILWVPRGYNASFKRHSIICSAISSQVQGRQLSKEQQAIQAFDEGKCSGLAASNFNTYQYNHFMGSSSGIGLIPNNRTARNLLQLLNHPTIEKNSLIKTMKWSV